ncbi:MAG: hypothetical protein ACK4E0_04330 [Chitinophagaceae bacterium]
MKKTLSIALVLLALAGSSSLKAQTPYRTALGVRVSSSPAMVSNSITLKHFISETAAIEALFSFGDPLAIGALYEIHKPLSAEGLRWFYGGGAYLGFVKTYNPVKDRNETDPNFGAQGVLGLDYKFSNAPINLSVDWKPELNLVSDINFEPAAVGFSVRFTF